MCRYYYLKLQIEVLLDDAVRHAKPVGFEDPYPSQTLYSTQRDRAGASEASGNAPGGGFWTITYCKHQFPFKMTLNPALIQDGGQTVLQLYPQEHIVLHRGSVDAEFGNVNGKTWRCVNARTES